MRDNDEVGYTILRDDELEWQPRGENDPREAAAVSHALTNSRANFFRYPPGSIGRRQIDPVQERVFVVLAGTLTVHLGDDGAVEQHELAIGSVLVVQPGTALQLSNRHDDELRLFIYGTPPERGDTVFLERIE